MPRGVKVFDVYGELHLDRDEVRQGLRSLPAEMGPDADRAGRELGRKMTDGLAKAVEASSARMAKARRSEQTATDAVKLAELRLSEAREKGGQKASTMLALEQRLEQAQRRLADAQSNTVSSTKKLEDAQHRLATAMGDVDKGLGPRAQKSGEDAGGKLALGMRMSVIRNSPLIVAAVGAGLAAGAPLMLTAATGLFAGIGIVAAAQSDKVRKAWVGTWDQVKQGAIADAAVIEPALVGMAGRVGAGFERMRPQLRDAFEAAAPQMGVFTDGVIALAENALPGLVRAVEQGMPVTRGFADFLAKTGTGLSDFFDRITAHGPAAGQVWSSLGDVMATLLPTLGELVGQGAELASVVLPMVSSSLGLVLKVVDGLGPALPVVVAGFAAMKIAGSLGGLFDTLGGKLKSVGTYLGLMSTGPGSAAAASTSLATLKGAVGPLTAAVGIAGAAFMASQRQIDDWAQALSKGGGAAEQARSQIAANESVYDSGAAKFQNLIMGTTNWANALGVGTNASEKASAKAGELWRAMDPLSQAQAKVAEWTSTLAFRLDDESSSAEEVRIAQERLAYWTGQTEQKQGDLDLAIQGVTQAMLDQANQAMGSIDADFAYQDALDQLEDKQRALADAIRDHGSASEEASDAQRHLAEGIWDTAQKAAAAAPELDGLKEGTAEYDRMVQNLTLRSLVELRKGLGPEMQAVVDQMIATLQAGGASLDEIGAMRPTPVVDADTTPLEDKNASAMRVLDMLAGKRPIPIADLDNNPLATNTQTSVTLLDVLGLRRPTPVADVNTSPFTAAANWVSARMGWLDTLRANPVATLQASTQTAEYYLNLAARNRTSTVYLRTVTTAALAGGGPVDSPIFAAIGRKVVGPGGPTEDRVPATGPGGRDYRLSPGEWITNAMVSRQQGDDRMALLNAGKADIVPRRPRGLAATGAAALSTVNGKAALSSGERGGGVTIAGNVILQIPGAFNLGNAAERRRLIAEIRDGLVELERSEA